MQACKISLLQDKSCASKDWLTQNKGEGFPGFETLAWFLLFAVKEFNIFQGHKDT